MDKNPCNSSSQDVEVRKGPWTMEEDLILINYIANHGEGVWNSLAKAAGLKRTGKSCRLRWLNYLRPDVRRGNITPEEQLLIMELHAKWGNRWSKIAKHLPGRTDNEIKNYWRTRIQKHIKQAENITPGQSSEVNDQASTSQVSISKVVDTMDISHSAPTHQANMDAYPPPLPADQSNDNYWSMEDLWSMQLLNGEMSLHMKIGSGDALKIRRKKDEDTIDTAKMNRWEIDTWKANIAILVRFGPGFPELCMAVQN